MCSRTSGIGVLSLALLLGCAGAARKPIAAPAAVAPLGERGNTAVVAAAGDIACDPKDPHYNHGSGTAERCHTKATSDLLLGIHPDAVLTLGDDQYQRGSLAAFLESYAHTWGRLKATTHPAAGNHEYWTRDAAGYFAYFGNAAGSPGKGYYSFNLNNWHLIALNSNCQHVGGCGFGSPQEQWLQEDLRVHPGNCILAYLHHARFSSGINVAIQHMTHFGKISMKPLRM
jgi:acid phosphatase type 7